MDCIVSTRDACLAHTEEALLSGRFVLLPWADEIDLGAGQRLPAAEAAVLSDPLSCMARFPAPPVPCNDLILIGVSPSSCAVAAPAADTEPALAIFGWLTGVALLAARRRPRR
jgi:hypothetical protein